MRTQGTVNSVFAATTASAEALPERAGRRQAFTIIGTTAGNTITVAKGVAAAVAGSGIVLDAKQGYVESNSEGFDCWQGPIQIVGSGSGNVGISETLLEEDRDKEGF